MQDMSEADLSVEPLLRSDAKLVRTFDRTKDVPKLFGYNTRSIEYRWDIFERHFTDVPPGSTVLDFGCGSLRETYELAMRGFRVTSFDLDENTIRSYYADYDWSVVAHQPEIVAGDIDNLRGRKFDFIVCFDVFEHLLEPHTLLNRMNQMLPENGILFCSMPNRRSLWEIGRRISWKVGSLLGRKYRAGEPHIQFKSPGEWRSFFEKGGSFKVIDHDMAIGFFVNTWSAIVGMPTIAIVRVMKNVRRGWSRKDRSRVSAANLRLCRALHAVDLFLATPLKGLAALNLMVVKKRS